jgi:hypothetical protein
MKNNQNLKRVIVDFSKLNDEILNMLVTKYPDGYDPSDIITFKNKFNELVECVEVRTEDTIYLVKVSKKLVAAMEDFEIDDDNDQDDLDNDDDFNVDFDIESTDSEF